MCDPLQSDYTNFRLRSILFLEASRHWELGRGVEVETGVEEVVACDDAVDDVDAFVGL